MPRNIRPDQDVIMSRQLQAAEGPCTHGHRGRGRNDKDAKAHPHKGEAPATRRTRGTYVPTGVRPPTGATADPTQPEASVRPGNNSQDKAETVGFPSSAEEPSLRVLNSDKENVGQASAPAPAGPSPREAFAAAKGKENIRYSNDTKQLDAPKSTESALFGCGRPAPSLLDGGGPDQEERPELHKSPRVVDGGRFASAHHCAGKREDRCFSFCAGDDSALPTSPKLPTISQGQPDVASETPAAAGPSETDTNTKGAELAVSSVPPISDNLRATERMAGETAGGSHRSAHPDPKLTTEATELTDRGPIPSTSTNSVVYVGSRPSTPDWDQYDSVDNMTDIWRRMCAQSNIHPSGTDDSLGLEVAHPEPPSNPTLFATPSGASDRLDTGSYDIIVQPQVSSFTSPDTLETPEAAPMPGL